MLKAIIESLKNEYSISQVSIFSDGCAAQFKNQFTVMNLCFMQEDYGVTGQWSFFASSHGNGAVEAVGGTIKRQVWRAVKARTTIVSDAKNSSR